ncbi:hypothetical protein SAMN03080615_01665 [Amphritea atlantica]|uniref:Uncharacterized protein n=1 Tax=Amphritea atlantica TaxID=355243 RepID=A0A1H9GGD6_9GAMM|nr:hypothetical protein [Amphritea atlantica]SEQ49103.1 hypothetical protein SAMN03080615_01665 [Amphritea atlantica]
MSDFDDALSAADADIADVLGDAATLNDGAADYPVQAILDKDVVPFGSYGTAPETHISIPAPPVALANGYTVTFTGSGEVYTLREERSNDGFMPTWAVTKKA